MPTTYGPSVPTFVKTPNYNWIAYQIPPDFYWSYGDSGPLWVRSVDRQATVRRSKPQGIELYFNGTGYSHQRQYTTYTLVNEIGNYGYHRTSNISNWVSAGSIGQKVFVPDLSSQLHAAVKDQKVNLAMALAEYRQTAALFSDLGVRVAAAWRKFRRADVLGVAYTLTGRGKKKFSANWLQFQYGVQPLYFDMIGSIKELEAAAIRGQYFFKVSVRGRARDSFTEVTNQYGAHRPITRITNQEESQRWTCYYTVDGNLVKQASALGFTNPVALAWELVPYSFVIDWFINVGDWLGQLDTLSGVNRTAVYKSTRYKEQQFVTFMDGASTYTNERTSRSGALPFPGIELQWEPSLSWKRIVSSVALLRQSRSFR